jgi:hypothetical protein
MGTERAIDKFRLREIEQQLAAEVQVARAQIRSATTEEEKRKASGALQHALQRFTDFAARNIVPEELLPPADRSVDK